MCTRANVIRANADAPIQKNFSVTNIATNFLHSVTPMFNHYICKQNFVYQESNRNRETTHCCIKAFLLSKKGIEIVGVTNTVSNWACTKICH